LTGPPWWALAPDEAAAQLGVELSAGLGAEELLRRQQTAGPNTLPQAPRRGALRMVLDQLTDFMVLVLIGAAVVAGLLGEPEDAVTIAIRRDVAERHPDLAPALVRAFAELHGGRMSIDSTLGEGTAVTVRLPVALIARAPAREGGAEIIQMPMKGGG
jgi:hypothetical protein